MTIKKRKGSNKRTGRCLLAATGNLTIDTVSQNHATLAELFADYRDFEIDLSSVEEIDCSGIQLLLALQHSACSDNKRLTLHSASTTVNDAIDLLQLRRQFDWSSEL